MLTIYSNLDGKKKNGKIVSLRVLKSIPGPGHRDYVPPPQDNPLHKEAPTNLPAPEAEVPQRLVNSITESEMNNTLDLLKADIQKVAIPLNGITLRNRDLLTLAKGEEEWVNDDVIDFYRGQVTNRSENMK